MHHFRYVKGRLHCEGSSIEALVEQYGSPLYVYSSQTLSDHYTRLSQSLSELDHSICYAVKANSNLGVLHTLAKLGSGFDTVSQGELMRVKAAGGQLNQCVFAGVGKTAEEIRYALKQGIYAFNVESLPELERIHAVAKSLGKKAPVAIRVNPNVDAKTHAKITTGTYENKFGVAFEEIEALYAKMSKMPHLHLRGIQMHIGSQLTKVKPFVDAVKKMVPLVKTLQERHDLECFSIGGGLGIVYDPALESGSPQWWKSEVSFARGSGSSCLSELAHRRGGQSGTGYGCLGWVGRPGHAGESGCDCQDQGGGYETYGFSDGTDHETQFWTGTSEEGSGTDSIAIVVGFCQGDGRNLRGGPSAVMTYSALLSALCSCSFVASKGWTRIIAGTSS